MGFLMSAADIAEHYRLDRDQLARKFEGWLGTGAGGGDSVSPQRGGSRSVSPSRRAAGEVRGEAERLRAGLKESMRSLWAALAAPGDAHSRRRNAKHGDEALASLRNLPVSDAAALRQGAESVLSEYLVQMQEKLERWVEVTDPTAPEVMDIAKWLLFDAKPAVNSFVLGLGISSGRTAAWRASLRAIERALLAEWETRCCEELFEECEGVYRLAPPGPSAEPGGGASPCAAAAAERRTVGDALGLLRKAAGYVREWRGNAQACNRATSVLIAALNAVLRSFRGKVRKTLEPTQAAAEKSGAAWLDRVRDFLRRSKKCQVPPVPRTTLLAEAGEAATLAEFCKRHKVTEGPERANAVCNDMLASFGAAFERECTLLGMILAESHFVANRPAEMQSIGFGQRQLKEALPQHGALGGVIVPAEGFLEEVCAGTSALCGRLLCEALAQTLRDHWVGKFCRRPPRLSSCPLRQAVHADEVALQGLALKWGADGSRPSPLSTLLQPFVEVKAILMDSTPEHVTLCSQRLQEALGEIQGHQLAEAARLAASR